MPGRFVLNFAGKLTAERRIFGEETLMGEAMLPSIAAVVAAIAGILVGFWLRGKSARTENAQLEMRAAELTRNLDAAKAT